MGRIFLDLDGVLADFHKVACAIHMEEMPTGKGPWDFWEEWDISSEDFWQPLDRAGFWLNLPWTKDGKQILETAVRCVGTSSVYILTHACSPLACFGKMGWVQRELPEFVSRLVMTPAKYVCAGYSYNLLVDDSDHNIEQWRYAGGAAAPVPRPWNRFEGDTADVLHKIRAHI